MKPEFKHHRPAALPGQSPAASPAASSPSAADAARPTARAGAAAVAVLLAGGLVLAASAVAGRVYWSDERSAGLMQTAPPAVPGIWLAAFEPAAMAGFADGRAETPLPEFPRLHIERGAAVIVRDMPVPARPEAVAAGVPALPVAPAGRPAADTAAVVPRVALTLPPLMPPRRPAVPHLYQAPPEGLAPALHAPGLSRSPLPRARPAQRVQPAGLLAAAEPPGASASPRGAAGSGRCEASLPRAIPARPGAAPGGAAVLAGLAQSGGHARDEALAQAIIAGNLPEFQRHLVPVVLEGQDAHGRPARITLCVMPDYLAIGSNADFVRVPLGLPAASRIAERFDMMLPTTRMVDAIHTQAGLRLVPEPMTPGPQMGSTDYFIRHNATLEHQRRAAGAALGVLVSGHKKDLVLSNRLARNPGRVAIYGWHRASGRPIQPLSTVHGAGYADYSHGIRLISRRAYVNHRAVDLRDLLADERYAGLLSDEGPIAPRLMLAALD